MAGVKIEVQPMKARSDVASSGQVERLLEAAWDTRSDASISAQ
jgi:hypothetical protein